MSSKPERAPKRSRPTRPNNPVDLTGQDPAEYRGCGRKVEYPSRAKANRAARLVGGGTRSYACEYGDHFHIGHPQPKRGR